LGVKIFSPGRGARRLTIVLAHNKWSVAPPIIVALIGVAVVLGFWLGYAGFAA
jgi:hypothetical protein